MITKTQGKDYNFFTKITVTDTSFPTNSQVTIPFSGQTGFSLVNEGSVKIEYSFNGSTLHGDLTPGTPTAAIIFDNRRISAIWFRASSSSIVRVEAWGWM